MEMKAYWVTAARRYLYICPRPAVVGVVVCLLLLALVVVTDVALQAANAPHATESTKFSNRHGFQGEIISSNLLCQLKLIRYSTDFYNALQLLRVSDKNIRGAQVLLQPHDTTKKPETPRQQQQQPQSLLDRLPRYELPRKIATRKPTHGWRRFFFLFFCVCALNLYSSENVIPFLSGALSAFVQDELAPHFFDVATSVVVSTFISK